MDVSLLIQMVRDREPLWNRQHPQYKDRELAATLWGQVAGSLNVDVETARYKWRGLRDTYRVQLRKLKRPGMKGFNQHIITSRWEYFNEMSFVKDHIYLDVNSKQYNTKKLKGESPNNDGFEEDNFLYVDEGSEDDYQNLVELCETEITEGDQMLENHFENGKSHEKDDSSDDLTLETSTDDKYSNNHSNNDLTFPNSFNSFEDDNLCFLLSILPQLKSLPNKRNLYVRIKMQELLLNEVVSLQNNV